MGVCNFGIKSKYNHKYPQIIWYIFEYYVFLFVSRTVGLVGLYDVRMYCPIILILGGKVIYYILIENNNLSPYWIFEQYILFI